MNELQLERYSRQILLPNFDIAGQDRLLNAKILIIGMGGLGNIAAAYLAAAGVSQLTLVDDDVVEVSNLQRQVLYRNQDIGQNKAAAAAVQLGQLNPDSVIEIVTERLDDNALAAHIANVDLVLDCSDNFATRQQINRECYRLSTSLVSAAAIRWEGQLMSFLYHQQTGPCYQCLYPNLSDQQLNCSQSGIISPVVGSLGVLQALDALKIISQCGVVQHALLRLFDGFTGQWREVKLTQDPACSICAGG